MAGYNTAQNRKITRRATISALALVALAFSGMAAGGVFNASTAGAIYEV